MYVTRDLEERFRNISGAINIVAIVGPRQCGKTTFLKHHSPEMGAKYVTFDDPDVRTIFSDIKAFERTYVEGNEYTILDEVQYGSDPGIKLKYLSDRGHRLWITSSSEILLSTDVLSYLVGRVSIQRLYPFNLEEMARSRDHTILTEDIEKRLISEHMRFGGYPGIVTQTDQEIKVDLLRSLYETLIYKDVAGTFSIKDMDSLSRLTRLIALNTGISTPLEGMSNDLGLSFQTTKKYIEALLKSYLIIAVPPYFTNKGLEIKKQSRFYYLDLGLRNAITNDFQHLPDGRSFENYVVSELYKCGFFPKYWRTKGGAEVDIIVEIGREVIPIEVKLTMERPIIGKGMRSFIEKYGPKRAFIVRYGGIQEEKRLGVCKVKITDMKGVLDMLKK